MTDTEERALLRRLDEAWRYGGEASHPFEVLTQVLREARALLAEPEGEKSSGCPRRQSPQAPCVLEVGPMDADEEGICVGCGMPWEGAVRQQERPTPRSRAEAEAMVEAHREAAIHAYIFNSRDDNAEWEREESAAAKVEIDAVRAALLRALTGGTE